MLASLWTGLGGKLAERLVAGIMTPAFVFAAGALLAWVDGPGSWAELEDWITTRGGGVQAALVAGILIGTTVLGMVVQRLALRVLRIFEGYWPAWTARLRDPLVRRQEDRRRQASDAWQALAAKVEVRKADVQDWAEYARLDRVLRRYPEPRADAPGRIMPTRLGNVLRASETRPRDKYGLDAVKCWPALWLVMPDGTKAEVSAARTQLDAGATVVLFGTLFGVWVIWAWWAVPVAIVVAIGAYAWTFDAAQTFGELVEAAFDVHRRALYDALSWPAPKTAAEEVESGAALTEYLWWGSDSSEVKLRTGSEATGS